MQVKKTEKFNRIIAAAIKLFIERNFHDVTLQDIATEAGVGKGTVYTYVSSKDELLVKCLTYNIPELNAEAAKIMNSPELSFKEAVHKLVEMQFEVMRTKTPLFQQFMNLGPMSFKGKEVGEFERCKQEMQTQVNRLAEFFQRAADRGDICSKFSPKKLAVVLHSLFKLNLSFEYFGESPLSADDLSGLMDELYSNNK